jgi:hypothetical protein
MLCVWHIWVYILLELQFFTDSRAVVLSRKSSDLMLQHSQQQQTNSAGPGPTGRSTPTPVGAVTVLPMAPHSPVPENVPGSKESDTASTIKASEEDSSADKPTMTWEPENAEENGSHALQNSEFNLDLDDILKIDSLPLLTVRIVLSCSRQFISLIKQFLTGEYE